MMKHSKTSCRDSRLTTGLTSFLVELFVCYIIVIVVVFIMPRKDYTIYYTGANRPHVNKVKSVDVQSLKGQHLVLPQLNMCVWTYLLGHVYSL